MSVDRSAMHAVARLHRFCAYGVFPAELRTSPDSADFPEQPCSEKGGDTMIHSQVTTRVQMGDDTAPDVVVSEVLSIFKFDAD